MCGFSSSNKTHPPKSSGSFFRSGSFTEPHPLLRNLSSRNWRALSDQQRCEDKTGSQGLGCSLRQVPSCCEGGQAASFQAGSACLQLVTKPAASHRFLPWVLGRTDTSGLSRRGRRVPGPLWSAPLTTLAKGCVLWPVRAAGLPAPPQLASAAWGRGPPGWCPTGPAVGALAPGGFPLRLSALGPWPPGGALGRPASPHARGLLGGGASSRKSHPSRCCLAPA